MKHHNFRLIYLRFMAAVLLLCIICSLNVFAKTDDENGKIEINTVYNKKDENSYLTYQEKNSNFKLAADDIVLFGGQALKDESTAAFEAENITDSKGNIFENSVVWKQDGTLVYRANVPQDALYNINITYLPQSDSGMNISFGLLIDGTAPFTESEDLFLPSCFKNDENKRYDGMGNQFSPQQVLLGEFVSRDLFDDTGASPLPYCFYLTKGEHTLTFVPGSEEVALAKITLLAPDTLDSYSKVSANYKKSDAKNTIIIEGEDACIKDTRAIVPKADTTSAIVNPASATKQILNYIGSTNWKTPGEKVVWKFDVEESGLYDLRMIYKQDQTVNGYSYRILEIDGKIPFSEAQNVKFYYGTSWQTYRFEDEKANPYLIWLDKGEHTLSLTATLGETAVFYNRLKEISSDLGDLYLEIAMITGESPDPNRDYDLFRQIGDFNEKLNKYYEQLTSLSSDMHALSGNQSTSCISAINNMAYVLKCMEENPYIAQKYVTDYYNKYTTVSSWLYDMKSMPLSIDRIYLVPQSLDYKIELPNILTKLSFSVKRFLVSFTADYTATSADEGEATLKIWVNWGRDQAMVLNSLIQESFTPKTGIGVNLEITDATLVKGILSNNAPDLALHLARTEPVNLAMRGALYDLKNFDDYNEVVKRFGESSSVPYEYGDGIYALPDTQSFYIMVYRTDIFESLGLSVPETWDEFLAVTAVLQRNNMQAWIPYTEITASTTVNTGVGGLNLFASILQQFGGKLYDNKKTICLLDSTDSLQAFTYWTEMYTKYKLPVRASFYNRFRIGTMPLGIEAYTNYTMLAQTAPEIDGRWGIACVPGYKDEEGNVRNYVSGSGTGCSILSTSENKDAAWEFLKWWTSADTQLSYNNNVESILGTVSRTMTATLEAFESMAWDKNDLEVLLEQRRRIQEIPEVPGSYYVSRSVDQAFWGVVNDVDTPKDSLMKWNEISNSEIERKIKQYIK